MTRRHTLLAAAVLTSVATGGLHAQTSVAFTPIGGYIMPMDDFTKQNDTLNLMPQGGIYLGLTVEFNLSKALSLTASATRTLGGLQGIEATTPLSGTTTFENDMATTELYATILFRPLGRLPSGAPNKLFVELGGGMTMYDISTGWTDPNDPNNRLADFNDQVPFVTAGAGLSFPVGPRSSLLLFARYQMAMTEYGGLDNYNSAPPVTAIETQKVNLLQFGAGLRVGR